MTMSPHVGFDADQIRDKARKDLLYLLEGVSKATHGPYACVARRIVANCMTNLGSRQEKCGD